MLATVLSSAILPKGVARGDWSGTDRIFVVVSLLKRLVSREPGSGIAALRSTATARFLGTELALFPWNSPTLCQLSTPGYKMEGPELL
jgi:hypothetical protein